MQQVWKDIVEVEVKGASGGGGGGGGFFGSLFGGGGSKASSIKWALCPVCLECDTKTLKCSSERQRCSSVENPLIQFFLFSVPACTPFLLIEGGSTCTEEWGAERHSSWTCSSRAAPTKRSGGPTFTSLCSRQEIRTPFARKIYLIDVG